MSDRYDNIEEENSDWTLCEPIADYCKQSAQRFREMQLFPPQSIPIGKDDIRVVELFAGVGGFRIGLERASKRFKTVWNNQWEPSTKRQDASNIYCHRFGTEGHCNEDIATVPTREIPECDLLVGGFPCQDYSVATTLKRSGGIEGKKGVLWWQIYRILNEMKHKPDCLFFENVDRLLSRRRRNAAATLPSFWPHWEIWDTSWSGASSMPPTTECLNAVAEPTSSDTAKTPLSASESQTRWTGCSPRGRWHEPSRQATAGRNNRAHSE